MAGTPLDELDNFYTDLKQSITEVDARINNLKSTPGINAEGESKEILKLITQIQTQRKLYAELLRQYVKKTDDAGTKVMTPEDVIEYKKKATEIEQETKRLRAELKSAKTAQTDHEELFAGGTEEKEPETAQEHWKATEGIQNETLEKAQAALSMGHEANAAADDALRKQEENMEMEKEIVKSSRLEGNLRHLVQHHVRNHERIGVRHMFPGPDGDLSSRDRSNARCEIHPGLSNIWSTQRAMGLLVYNA